MDRTLANLLAGTPHFRTPEVDEAVSQRFATIRHTPAFEQRDGDYVYDGSRCVGQNLGWRFMQHCNLTGVLEMTAGAITAGLFDEQIAETYHDAASAEYYYRYEKDWGEDH